MSDEVKRRTQCVVRLERYVRGAGEKHQEHRNQHREERDSESGHVLHRFAFELPG